MTSAEKQELKELVKEGCSFKVIRGIVNCSDATIRLCMKVFRKPKRTTKSKPKPKDEGGRV